MKDIAIERLNHIHRHIKIKYQSYFPSVLIFDVFHSGHTQLVKEK